jgi:hypothetical protein
MWLEVTPVSNRCGLFGSNAARVVGLCRTMEHGTALARSYLLAGTTGGGVMVRRLSLASLDSGAESPVYVGEPSASAGRGAYATGDVPPRGAARCGAATRDWMPPSQVVTGRAATRRTPRHVGHRPAKRKMVCKGHPCIYAADGNPMIWFASTLAVPRGRCGRRSLRIAAPPGRARKRTDVHGREG